MNLAQITGLIRLVLGAFSGGLMAKGVITTDQISQAAENLSSLIGLVIAVATGYWSWRSNHPSSLAAQLRKSNQPLSDQIK